jgi:hypothetical protein
LVAEFHAHPPAIGQRNERPDSPLPSVVVDIAQKR